MNTFTFRGVLTMVTPVDMLRGPAIVAATRELEQVLVRGNIGDLVGHVDAAAVGRRVGCRLDGSVGGAG